MVFSKWYTIGLGGCDYFHPDIVENGNIKVLHEQYVTEVIANKAIEYLNEFQHPKKNPFIFLCILQHLILHGRRTTSKKWMDYYENCDFQSIPDEAGSPGFNYGIRVFGTEREKKISEVTLRQSVQWMSKSEEF